mgnify:CR=1 FL=1
MLNQVNKLNGIHDGKQTYPTIFAQALGNRFVINITSDFDSSDTYDEVVALLSNSTEADEIVWNISSYGGFVNSLSMILGWKAMCPAHQTHVLHSNADSCASVFFLSDADQYIVGDGATMFLHEIQAGVSGTTSNMIRHMEHLKETNETFIKRSYSGFVSEEEMDQILMGVEVFLTSEQIRERLTARQEKRSKETQEQALQHIKELEEAEFDYSELSIEELEEELQMHKEDMKKVNKALADKKKESEVVLPVRKAVAKKRPVATK